MYIDEMDQQITLAPTPPLLLINYCGMVSHYRGFEGGVDWGVKTYNKKMYHQPQGGGGGTLL